MLSKDTGTFFVKKYFICDYLNLQLLIHPKLNNTLKAAIEDQKKSSSKYFVKRSLFKMS